MRVPQQEWSHANRNASSPVVASTLHASLHKALPLLFIIFSLGEDEKLFFSSSFSFRNEQEQLPPSIAFTRYIMMFTFFALVLIIDQLHSKSLVNLPNSTAITIRHLRLPTNNQQYQIQCPYDFDRILLKFFNYTTEHCFNLFSASSRSTCSKYLSSCLFHAKQIPLHCDPSVYSEHVEIIYQCSSSE